MKYLALVVVVVLLLPVVVLADLTVNIPTNADAWVASWMVDSNFNSWDSVLVRKSDGNREARAYLAFDTTALLPPSATVTSARLWLYNYSNYATGTSGTADLAAFRADGRTSWTESTITWGNQPGSAGDALDTSTYSTYPPGGFGWQSWGVTDGWATRTDLSFVILDTAGPPPVGSVRQMSFGSRAFENGSKAPYLQVSYDLPSEGSGGTPELPANALLSLSMIPMGLAWLRRRGKR